MQNLKRKIDKIKAKLLIRQQFLNNFSKNNRLELKKRSFSKTNKRHLRADVLSLLSSALRPRLLGAVSILNHPITDSRNTYSKKPFFSDNRSSFGFNVAKIVALSTILGISGLFSLNSATSVFADSLTLTIPSSPLSLDLNPSVNNGFATTSGTFNVKTINSSGYTVSIKSKNESGDNSLINGVNKLTSIAESTTSDNFKNDSRFLNMWGWMPNKLNSEDNTNYQIAPGKDEVVLDKTEEASGDAGTDYSISLAAKVASDTPTGKYENTFVVSATSNELPPDGIMQEWDGCDGLEPEQSVRLLDNRDNNVYTVTKLKDGKCWMTENLRITGDSVKAAGVSVDLDSTNTDISGSGKFTIPDSNISKFNVGSSNWNTTTGKNNDAAYVKTTAYTDSVHGAKNFESGYYTWHTATAGTGTADQTTEGWNAPSSICPKGWRLPTGGSGGDFETLTNAYDISNNAAGSNTLRGEPLNFTYAGYVGYGNGALVSQGSDGDYWSSTVSGQGGAYYLNFYGGDVRPTLSNSRPLGYSVRCIAKEYKSMQKVSEWYDEVKTGETVEAKDERDGSVYTVARLNDGKLWMTQNLTITGSSSFQSGHSATLSSSDTDLPDGKTFTLPENNQTKFNVGGISSSSNEWKDTNAVHYGDNANYGAHYTWYTATAGTGNHTLTTQDQNASGSICPKGWHLPTSGSDTNSDFQLLAKIFTTGSRLVATPIPAFTYAGYVNINGGSLFGQGSNGGYWSSTASSDVNAYLLDFYNSGVNPTGSSSRPIGFSVRCVARNPGEYSITYDPGLDACNDSVDLSEVDNMPSSNPQTGIAENNTVTLSSNTPIDPGTSMQGNLTFNSWCNVKPTSHDVCPGTTYAPGSTYQITDGNTNITLYAIWDGSTGEACTGGSETPQPPAQ